MAKVRQIEKPMMGRPILSDDSSPVQREDNREGLEADVLVNLIIVKQSPVRFFKSLGEASMMALATCSSMATMPVNVENTTRLGVPRETATMVIGAGTAIINGGSSFYKAIGVVFIASLYGVTLSGTQLLVVAALSAFLVTAGVPAAGTLSIAVALTALGIEPPAIDVWDFGALDGRVVEIPPTS